MLKGLRRAVLVSAMVVLASAGVARADTPGNLVVVEDFAPFALFSYSPAGVRLAAITTGGNLAGPEGVVRLGTDDYLIADKGAGAGANGKVIRVTNGVQSVVSAGGLLIDPHGIALSPDRKTAYTTGRDGSIVAVTIAGGAQRLLKPNNAADDIRGVAVTPTGDLIVINTRAAALGSQVLRVSPATGAQTVIASGPPLVDPRSILLKPNGDLIVGDTGGAADAYLLRIDPAGTKSVIAAGPQFAGTGNVVPGGLALETSGSIVFSDRNNPAPGGLGRLLRLDPNGALTVFVPPAAGQLSEPSGIAVVPPKCKGKFATIYGTDAAETLIGTPGPDVIVAGGGKDVVKGLKGKDLLCGGKGKDKLVGGKGKDTLVGGPGRDTLKP
jgi:sugar lactone lactonase YvrE